MTLSFRANTTADELYQLAKRAYHGSPWTKQIIAHDLANRFVSYLIVENDGEAIGFVGGTLIADELSISNVAVVPEFQGQRIGEQLLVKYLAQFETGVRALLEVRAGNKHAHRLYERLGFEIYNIREDYYSDPREDAYLMDVHLPLAQGEE